MVAVVQDRIATVREKRKFSRSGKVREFRKKSGKFFDTVKFSEKFWNLLVRSNALCTKSSQKWKEVENGMTFVSLI